MSRELLVSDDPLVMAVRQALKDVEPRNKPTEIIQGEFGVTFWQCPYCKGPVRRSGGPERLGQYNMHFGAIHSTAFWKELHLIEVIQGAQS